MPSSTYNPPSSSFISSCQDEDDSLRLLLAQRKLYSKAKFWLALRMSGMGIIALLAPVIAFILPEYAVSIGAIAGAWLFLGRTVFLGFEKNLSAKAAAAQESFDIRVFRMPQLTVRAPMPSLEEIAIVAGSDSLIRSEAEKENLLEWYTINSNDSGKTSIAICQRINTSYSRSLLSSASRVWLGTIIFWSILLIILSLKLGLKLETFLLAVMLPLLPAYLDLIEFWKGLLKAGNQRHALTQEVESKIKNNTVSNEDLLVWQTQMYDLRRDMPLVPDWVYNFYRKVNERAMKSAADQLSDSSR